MLADFTQILYDFAVLLF